MTDQQRADTLGFRGETPCKTPNIDRLAREGVSFDRAITPCPLCLPARSAVFTGLYPNQNDMMDNTTGYLARCQLLDHFRLTGYQVNYAGKWHLGEGNIAHFTDWHAGDSTAIYSAWCKDQGLIDGWMFNDPTTRTTRQPSMSIPVTHVQDLPVDKTNEAYVVDFAIEMIRSRDRQKPFFQVCSLNGPHPPFMIPEPYYSMYGRADVTMPENFGPQVDEPEANRTSFYRRLFLDHGADFDAWRSSYAVYWGFVSMIDDQLGRIFEALEAEALMSSTVVVLLSDHGENMGAHGLWQKMAAYEESIRVPLIFRLPGSVEAGVRSNAPVSQIDLAPTLAALCGLPALPEWMGKDLSPLFEGEAAEFHNRPVFAMHKPLGDWMKTVDWRMAQRNQLKYVWNRGDRDELFDLSIDPFEVRNLIDDPSYSDLSAALRGDLQVFLQETRDPLSTNLIQL